MKCPRCNSVNSENARFCSKCGKPFVKAAVPAPLAGSTAGSVAQVLVTRAASSKTGAVSKNTTAHWLALGGGLIILIAFFLPWFGVKGISRPVELSGLQLATGTAYGAEMKAFGALIAGVVVAWVAFLASRKGYSSILDSWLYLGCSVVGAWVVLSGIVPIETARQELLPGGLLPGFFLTMAGFALVLFGGINGVLPKKP